MKYKVGDKVRIKPKFHFCSVDGFNNINMKDEFFNEYSRLPYCETVMTIGIVNKDFYILKEDKWAYKWTDEMIEGLSEDIERENDDKIFSEGYDQGYEDGQHDMNEWVLPKGFQFKDENGNLINAQKIVLEKKYNGYPETYEECVEILGRSADVTYGYKNYVLHTLQMLLVCRDAYWQIAGDEMGLDEPWEPDYRGTFEHGTPIKYVIYNIGTHIVKERKSSPNHILSFPTEEMGNAFFENFKEEIEKCKELL